MSELTREQIEHMREQRYCSKGSEFDTLCDMALRTVQAESAYDSQTCPDPQLGIALARLAEMKAAQIHRTAEAQLALALMTQERDMFESADKAPEWATLLSIGCVGVRAFFHGVELPGSPFGSQKEAKDAIDRKLVKC